MIDITNEVFTKLKTELADVNVTTSFVTEPTEYPTITFMELDNSTDEDTKDSSGEVLSNILFEVNIYTTGDSKLSDAKTLRSRVDTVLNGYYGMRREFSNPVPNFLNNTVYRFILRYGCSVDKSSKIYGR